MIKNTNMEVTRFDAQMEYDNCECENCSCHRGDCWHKDECDAGDVNEYTGSMESRGKVNVTSPLTPLSDGVMGNVRKVRCDQDDVNGVCLDDMLEKWLEPLAIDEDMDLPVNGICVDKDKSTNGERVDASMVAAASDDEGVGMCIEKSTDTLVVEMAPIDAARDAWVERFCKPAASVMFEDIGVDRTKIPRWEKVKEMAYAAEKSMLGDISVTPPKLTKSEVLQFYAHNHCRCSRMEGDICGFCASNYRRRAREELKGKADREVRKTLFKSGDDECDKSGGGWPEAMM